MLAIRGSPDRKEKKKINVNINEGQIYVIKKQNSFSLFFCMRERKRPQL